MLDYRMRYRTQGRPRSAWKEWGPFLLALILSACVLFVFARNSIPESAPRPSLSGHVSGGGGGGDAAGGGGGSSDADNPTPKEPPPGSH